MNIMNYIEEHKATSVVIGIIIVGGIIYVAYSYKQPAGNIRSITGSSQNANNYNAAVTSLNLERSKNAIQNNENILAYNASVNSTEANITKEKLQANAYKQNLIVKKSIAEINANTQIVNSKLSFASLAKADNTMQNIAYYKAQQNIYESSNNAQSKVDQAYFQAQGIEGVANAKAIGAEETSYNKYAYPAYMKMIEYSQLK